MNSIIKLFEISSNRSKGFFLIIVTYFIFSIMELIAKDLGQRYDPLFICLLYTSDAADEL